MTETQALKGRQKILPPFQGLIIMQDVDPGLTPWAKLWRRFAAGTSHEN